MTVYPLSIVVNGDSPVNLTPAVRRGRERAAEARPPMAVTRRGFPTAPEERRRAEKSRMARRSQSEERPSRHPTPVFPVIPSEPCESRDLRAAILPAPVRMPVLPSDCRHEKKTLASIKNEDAEHRFWATHDSTDYLDWRGAKRALFPNLKPTSQTISLRLPNRAWNDQQKNLRPATPSKLSIAATTRAAPIVSPPWPKPKRTIRWRERSIESVKAPGSPSKHWVSWSAPPPRSSRGWKTPITKGTRWRCCIASPRRWISVWRCGSSASDARLKWHRERMPPDRCGMAANRSEATVAPSLPSFLSSWAEAAERRIYAQRWCLLSLAACSDYFVISTT